MGPRPEQTCEQTGDGKVGIEFLPMQAGACAQDLDLRELFRSGGFQTLG
jgi:hypothetical protein